METRPSQHRLVWTFLALLVLGVGSAWLFALERAGRAKVREASIAALARVRQPAEVVRAVRTMKLVTVQLDTSVHVERGEESWRGDVKATLTAPVRLHFGTDLTNLDISRVVHTATLAGLSDAPAGAYILTLPVPERVATEVFTEREATDVEAGWLRMRTRSGEYYLGLARRDAPEQARDLVLLPHDQTFVREATREQVAALVKAVVGDDAAVRVLFEDESAAAVVWRTEKSAPAASNTDEQ